MKYYTSDNVPIGIKAFKEGSSINITSATVDIWNPSNTKIVSAASMTVSDNEAAYQVVIEDTNTDGTFKYEITAVLSGGDGTRSYQGTFIINARYP